MSEWQPIETAPKSRAHILGFGNGPGIEQCCYVMRWEDADAGIDGWCEVYDCRVVAPTHWMPLPPPPKETGR